MQQGWDGRMTNAATRPTAVAERYVGKGDEPVLYTNAVQVIRSSHDVAIQVGVVLSATPDSVTTRVLASVYMSDSHARALLALLQQVLTPPTPETPS